MNQKVSVKIGRKSYLLNAQSAEDKKGLVNAGLRADSMAEMFLNDNQRMSNEDVLMMTCLTLAHELEKVKSQQESETKMLEQLHNSLADKLEKLI